MAALSATNIFYFFIKILQCKKRVTTNWQKLQGIMEDKIHIIHMIIFPYNAIAI